MGDIRFVLSHGVVSRYATHEQKNLSRTWMRLLVFVQGMDPQKRETGIHIQEENEFMHMPLVLDHSIASIQPLLVDGAFSSDGNKEANNDINMQELDTGDDDNARHAKVGRLSQESTVSGATGKNTSSSCSSKVVDAKSDPSAHLLIPLAVTQLAHECLCVLENCLGVDDCKPTSKHDFASPSSSSISANNFLALKETLSKIRKGKNIFNRLTGSSEVPVAHSGINEMVDVGKESITTVTPETNSAAPTSAGSCETEMEEESALGSSGLHVLSLREWQDILYDVSLQEVSVHIPIHRLLSMILQKALRRCFGESRVPDVNSESPLPAVSMDFFGVVLRGCHPNGFSAFVMEHPLRIRVFCAQVHAGMWRKNGDSAMSTCEWYRSVRW